MPNDPLDTILATGSMLDWISPLFAFIKDLFNQPFCDFGILSEYSPGSRGIKRILGEHGIEVWGTMHNFEGDLFMFTVKKRHARKVHEILLDLNIPVEYSPFYT